VSLFFVVGSLIQIIGIIFSKPLADRFGKKTVFIAGMAVTMIATVLVFFIGPGSIGAMFGLSILWAIGWGPTVPLLWVMIADVADYSEWQTSRRATGFMYAGILFALKAGLSLGGALSAWVLDLYGYVPNVAQTGHALLGIRLGASALSGAGHGSRPHLSDHLSDRQEARICASRMNWHSVANSSPPTYPPRNTDMRSRSGFNSQNSKSFMGQKMISRAVFLAVLLAFLAAGVAADFRSAATANLPALKDVFKKDFLIGAALNQNQFTGRDQRGLPIITSQFNSITPENVLKWESVHPEAGRYSFDAPDRFVAFGEKHQMFIVGHTLVWHSQTPRWVFEDGKGGPVDRETLLERMREHIHTVVGRYKGRIKGWDVVNEALDEDGTLAPDALDENHWRRIPGESF
jgi:hypothetical protein